VTSPHPHIKIPYREGTSLKKSIPSRYGYSFMYEDIATQTAAASPRAGTVLGCM